MTTPKFDAVLFDCDGVLVDSEPITNGVLRDMLEESGWALSPAECMRLFIGMAGHDAPAALRGVGASTIFIDMAALPGLVTG